MRGKGDRSQHLNAEQFFFKDTSVLEFVQMRSITKIPRGSYYQTEDIGENQYI